jgi:hypothetical protein
MLIFLVSPAVSVLLLAMLCLALLAFLGKFMYDANKKADAEFAVKLAEYDAMMAVYYRTWVCGKCGDVFVHR